MKFGLMVGFFVLHLFGYVATCVEINKPDYWFFVGMMIGGLSAATIVTTFELLQLWSGLKKFPGDAALDRDHRKSKKFMIWFGIFCLFDGFVLFVLQLIFFKPTWPAAILMGIGLVAFAYLSLTKRLQREIVPLGRNRDVQLVSLDQLTKFDDDDDLTKV